MIIINDFFKRRKEAVSNQMELISKDNKCKIVSATRFMEQQPLQEEDIKDNIYIYHPLRYKKEIIKHLKTTEGLIHEFEEEPSIFKRIVFNKTKRPLYVSLYRMPTDKECIHLKKYKYLKAIFVELETHKDKLISFGFNKEIIHITKTPTKFKRCKSKKELNMKNVNIVFASWNMKEGKPLYERGLLYLLDLLVKNKYLTLTVILRDHDTEEFIEEINKRGIEKRVELVDVETDKELEKIFEECDFVAFTAQKKIVKDVPNSLIDGLCKGKPVIISDVLNFSEIVKKEKIGVVVKKGEEAINLKLTKKYYEEMQENAYNYSKIHSMENYVKKIKEVYKQNGDL